MSAESFTLPSSVLNDATTAASYRRGSSVMDVRSWRKAIEEARPMSDCDGFFVTGDLGKFEEAGYLHIVGRGKDLIISGGFNVYPKEVETEIDAISGVLESAVIGIP